MINRNRVQLPQFAIEGWRRGIWGCNTQINALWKFADFFGETWRNYGFSLLAEKSHDEDTEKFIYPQTLFYTPDRIKIQRGVCQEKNLQNPSNGGLTIVFIKKKPIWWVLYSHAWASSDFFHQTFNPKSDRGLHASISHENLSDRFFRTSDFLPQNIHAKSV